MTVHYRNLMRKAPILALFLFAACHSVPRQAEVIPVYTNNAPKQYKSFGDVFAEGKTFDKALSRLQEKALYLGANAVILKDRKCGTFRASAPWWWFDSVSANVVLSGEAIPEE